MNRISNLFLAMAAMALLLVGCSRGPANALTIQEACKTLKPDATESVPADQWPDAIAQLHPSSVKVEGDIVWIFLSQEIGKAATGYVYVPENDPLPTAQQIQLTKTGAPDLHGFVQQP